MDRRPPGPPTPFLGLREIQRIKADTVGYYTALQKQYGDAVYLRLGWFDDYTFFHPEQVREVLVTKAKAFPKMAHQVRVFAQWNGRHSILLSEGDEWLRVRRLAQPAFHARRLAGYATAFVDAARRFAEQWGREGGPREVTAAMTDLSLEIAARTLFGLDLAAEARAIGQVVAELNAVAMRELMQPFILPPWLPLPSNFRKRKAIAAIDATVRGMIRQWREAGRDRGDLLSMLLLATDEEGDGRRMTDEEARDSLVTLLLAGHDTSAAGLTWCLYVLTQYPEVAARVRAEVDAVAGDRPLTYADQERLPYTEQVVKETMRLYPPTIGTFAREAAEDVEVGGYLLRKGSLVHLLSVITQRDPRWFPEPERFDPERFAPGRAEKIPPFAYFPFGGGPRVCIGNTFAMTELVLVTATLAQMLDFRLAPGQGPVEPAVGMSLRPRGGLRLVAARRERVAA